MEGLIKGLIDVAIGHDDDNNNNNEQSAPQSRDERSRSTWAQVPLGFVIVDLVFNMFCDDLGLGLCR